MEEEGSIQGIKEGNQNKREGIDVKGDEIERKMRKKNIDRKKEEKGYGMIRIVL